MSVTHAAHSTPGQIGSDRLQAKSVIKAKPRGLLSKRLALEGCYPGRYSRPWFGSHERNMETRFGGNNPRRPV